MVAEAVNGCILNSNGDVGSYWQGEQRNRQGELKEIFRFIKSSPDFASRFADIIRDGNRLAMTPRDFENLVLPFGRDVEAHLLSSIETPSGRRPRGSVGNIARLLAARRALSTLSRE